MNLSSIVVKVLPEHSVEVIEKFQQSDYCEFHLYENGNIIVTIEGKDVDSEIEKMKLVEKTTHVISASLVYSYLEDEIEAKVNMVENNSDMPDWLNDENINAQEIPYGGNIKNKF